MSKVLVVGRGTIGEGAILLLRYLHKFDYDTYFTNKTPREEERPEILQLINKGATFAPYKEKFKIFEKMGMSPGTVFEEILPNAEVVIDCTDKGNGLKNKDLIYEDLPSSVGVIGQGSEKGFGIPYMYNLADDYLKKMIKQGNRFVQVQSCNTHATCAIIQAIGLNNGKSSPDDLVKSNFFYVRRGSDVGQKKPGVKSIQVSPFSENESPMGSHQALDAYDLFKETCSIKLSISGTAIKVPTSEMHGTYFSMIFKSKKTKEEILRSIEEHILIATTKKNDSHMVHHFGRFGDGSRIFNHAVVPIDTIRIEDEGRKVSGMFFTPQESNSILSSLAATVLFTKPNDFSEIMKCFLDEPFVFKEV